MRYIIDNDLHIHSNVSSCSHDGEQTTERILQYAKENALKTICLTDHLWDEKVDGASEWYSVQNYEHIISSKPLPQDENVRFLFGCETEINRFLTLGISKERMDLFDFIIVPTTHLHMVGYTVFEEEVDCPENIAKTWVKRLDSLFEMDLPFHKIGIAHLTCPLIAPAREEYIKALENIPEKDMKRLFQKAAKLGCGIELNASDMRFDDEEKGAVLRPYRIAKECGCKFYLGSDAHAPSDFNLAKARFEKAVCLLELREEDKFKI